MPVAVKLRPEPPSTIIARMREDWSTNSTLKGAAVISHKGKYFSPAKAPTRETKLIAKGKVVVEAARAPVARPLLTERTFANAAAATPTPEYSSLVPVVMAKRPLTASSGAWKSYRILAN